MNQILPILLAMENDSPLEALFDLTDFGVNMTDAATRNGGFFTRMSLPSEVSTMPVILSAIARVWAIRTNMPGAALLTLRHYKKGIRIE